MDDDSEDSFDELLAKMQRQMDRKTPLNWYIKHAERAETSYVKDHKAVRWLVRRALILWVVGMLLTFLVLKDLHGSLFTVLATSLFFGGIVGTAGTTELRRAQAYRNGWLDGRREIYDSLDEAGRREMSMEEWQLAQIEKDGQVMW